jgi:CBS domain-containing protein
MKVQDIMSTEVRSCRPDSTLAQTAMAMWHGDCGTMPVVNDEGKVVAMITDRDICMAAATKHRTLDRIAVREVVTGAVYSCDAGDDVGAALETMRAHQVRRLPIVDEDGHLKGILSMNDIVLHAGASPTGILPEEVVGALKGICEHRHLKVATAGA